MTRTRVDPIDGPCEHRYISAYVADDRVGMWACADCSRRFYPACEQCVSVGHREEHEAEPDYLSAREQRRLACACGCPFTVHNEYGCELHGSHEFRRVYSKPKAAT